MATFPAALLLVAAAWPAPVDQIARPAPDRPAAPAPGLGGVFPESVPGAVDSFAFSALGDGWAEWSDATAAAVTVLYLPDAPAARQRAAVETLRGAVRRLDAAAKATFSTAEAAPLRDLRGALHRRAELAAAVLDARAAAAGVPADAAIAGANRRLAAALTALRADLAAIPRGDRWLAVARADRLDKVAAGSRGSSVGRLLKATAEDLSDPTVYDAPQAAFLARPAWRRLAAAVAVRRAAEPAGSDSGYEEEDAATAALRAFVAAFERYEAGGTDEAALALTGAAADLSAVAPAAGRAPADLLADLYDEDNARVWVGEGLLRRFIAQTRVEEGAVSDVAFGARVRGTQRTAAAVDVDVVPEVGAARFDVVLSGVAVTDTVSRTRQARVESDGRHRFVARKTLRYDGTRFRGGRTTVVVDPALRNRRIDTIYDDLAGGLFRDLIQRQAFEQAARRQPAALARTRRKLGEALRPQLDRRLTEQFDVVNLKVGGALRKRAERLGVAPSRERISSTDDEMRVFLRLSDGRSELAATPAPPRPVALDGAVFQVHHSALNNSADRLDLAGRTVTPDELGGILRGFFGELFGRDIPSPPPSEPSVGEDPPPKLTFAAADPIRVRFAANRVIATVRIGLAASPKADGSAGEEVPPQRVSIPFDVDLTDHGDLTLTRGGLSVAPLGRPESRFRQQAIGRILRGRLGDAIPEVSTVPARTVVAVDARTRVPLRLASLEIADGWATANRSEAGQDVAGGGDGGVD